MTGFTFYWLFYIFTLVVFTFILYGWRKYEETSRIPLYILTTIMTIYLGYGPVNCVVNVSHELELADEYRNYQKHVIMPVEDRMYDAMIPDGFYYLGAEITSSDVNIEDGLFVYYYEFGAVDYMESTNLYWYKSNEPLRDDIKYLLVLDSLGTRTPDDDQVVTVWQLVS